MPTLACPWCSFGMMVEEEDDQMTTFKAHLLRRHQVSNLQFLSHDQT